MMVETKKGKFKLIKNVKEAFDVVKFEDKFIEECFQKYDYLVGDVSDGILRLKGFMNDEGEKSYKKNSSL